MDSYFVLYGALDPSSSVANVTSVDGHIAAWETVANENRISQVIPHSLTLSSLRVDLKTAPSGSRNWDFTILKNGSATALTVNILGAALTATDSTHSVSFTAGDTIALQVTPNVAGIVLPAGISMTVKQTSASGQAILFGQGSSQQTANIIFSPAGGNAAAANNSVLAPWPAAGTISNMWVKADVDPGGSAVWTITLRLAGVDVAPTAVLTHGLSADGNGHLTASDSSSSSITAGQNVSVRATVANVSASPRISGGFTWNPTVAGTAVMCASNSATTAGGSTTNYQQMHGGDTAYRTAEVVGAAASVLQAMTLKALYTSIPSSAAPGSYAVTARANATTDTALTATIASGSTTSNLTGQAVAVSTGDNYDIEVLPSSSPTAKNLSVSVSYSVASTAVSDVPLDRRTRRRVIYR